MRVISLTCSNTEIVCALGCAEMLVGVDKHSDYPEEVVRNLARVGPDLQIDIEKVASLRPDLVLASLTVPGHERIIEGLQKAKLPFLAPEPTRLADIYDDIRLIAQHLGVPERAASLVDSMTREIEANASPDADGPSILVQWWPKPVIAPGQQSWLHDMLLAAGAKHPLQEEQVKSRPLTDEEVHALAPDAFVISWCGVSFEKYRPDVLLRNPVWQDLPAIQNKRIYSIPEAYMGRPSPRLIEGFRALQDIVKEIKATPPR